MRIWVYEDAAQSQLESDLSEITSKLSERPLKSADQKMERSKVINPEYSIDRDQPTSRASPLRINDLLSTRLLNLVAAQISNELCVWNNFGSVATQLIRNYITQYDPDVIGPHRSMF